MAQVEVQEAEVLESQQEAVLPCLEVIPLLALEVLLLQRVLQVALGTTKGSE